MFQGMDQYIYYVDKLFLLHSLNSEHTPDDSSRKDHHDTLVDMCIHRCYIVHSVHMVKDCKDHQRLDLFLNRQDTKTKMQKNISMQS